MCHCSHELDCNRKVSQRFHPSTVEALPLVMARGTSCASGSQAHAVCVSEFFIAQHIQAATKSVVNKVLNSIIPVPSS